MLTALALVAAGCGGSSGGAPSGSGGGGGGGNGGGTGGGGGGASFPTPATYKTSPLHSTPHQLAIDSAGNVWVACSGENQTGTEVDAVVKVTPQGTVGAQYALDQFARPNAIAIDAGGNLWVTGTTTPYPAQYNSSPYCCSGDPHESVTQMSPGGAVMKNVLLVFTGPAFPL